jgi:hypothetical protein
MARVSGPVGEQFYPAAQRYADAMATRLATFLPTLGLDYDHDLLTRAERYLHEVPIDRSSMKPALC